MAIDMESPSGGWDYGIRVKLEGRNKGTIRVWSNKNRTPDNVVKLWIVQDGIVQDGYAESRANVTVQLTADEAEALGIALIDLANKTREIENGKD